MALWRVMPWRQHEFWLERSGLKRWRHFWMRQRGFAGEVDQSKPFDIQCALCSCSGRLLRGPDRQGGTELTPMLRPNTALMALCVSYSKFWKQPPSPIRAVFPPLRGVVFWVRKYIGRIRMREYITTFGLLSTLAVGPMQAAEQCGPRDVLTDNLRAVHNER